jgi:hypothetical protein
MHFFRPFVAAALLAYNTPLTLGALSPTQIVDEIQKLTAVSEDLQATAEKITFIDDPLLIIDAGQFPQIITGFEGIVSLATSSIAQMQGSSNIASGSDADSVPVAFRKVYPSRQAITPS